MAIYLSEPARMYGTYGIEVTLLDDADEEATPVSLTWTLTDRLGNIINNRENVPITPAAHTVLVVLAGNDLKSVASGDQRVMTVRGVYSSDIGSNLPTSEDFIFVVEGGPNSEP